LIQRPSELPAPGSKPASLLKLAREVSRAKQAVKQAFSETSDDEARERHVMNNFKRDHHSQMAAKALLNHLSEQMRIALPAVKEKTITKLSGPEQAEGAGAFPSTMPAKVVKKHLEMSTSLKKQLDRKRRKAESKAPEQAEGAGQFRPVPAAEVAAYRADLQKRLRFAEDHLQVQEQSLARDEHSEVTAENTERIALALTKAKEHTRADLALSAIHKSAPELVNQERKHLAQDVKHEQLLRNALKEVSILPSAYDEQHHIDTIEKDKAALSLSLASMIRLRKLKEKLAKSYADLKHEDLVLQKKSVRKGAEAEAVSELHIVASPTSSQPSTNDTGAIRPSRQRSHNSAKPVKHAAKSDPAHSIKQKPSVPLVTIDRSELSERAESKAEDTVAWAAKQKESRRLSAQQAQIEADEKVKQRAAQEQGVHKISANEAEANAERVLANEDAKMKKSSPPPPGTAKAAQTTTTKASKPQPAAKANVREPTK
jgi:hypothetical protein